MKLIKSLKGYRPLTFVPDGILLAKGYKLFVADLDVVRLDFIGLIPQSAGIRLANRSRLLERILRLGVRFGCHVSGNKYLLAERRRIWLLDLGTRSIQLDHVVARGSRPLSINYIHNVNGFDNVACFGEYWENKYKDPVNIWTRDERDTWNIAYTFPKGKIEHVHAVIPDARRGLVWILTGDFENSAGIWVARNNFLDVSPVLVGQQESRCCWLAFWGDRILYATDSPLLPNSIRELVFPGENANGFPSSNNARSEHLMDTAGSSIYACMVQDQLVFSTTVEPGLPSGMLIYDLLECKPGAGIKGNYLDLVAGSPQRGFSVIGTWHKDRLPPRLGELGTISFPSGDNPGSHLFAYFTGVSGNDGSMSVFKLPPVDDVHKISARMAPT